MARLSLVFPHPLRYHLARVSAREEEDMPRIGPTELIIILVIVIIVFGVGRLSEVGGALGKGIRAFKRGQSGEDEVDEKAKAKEIQVTVKETARAKT